MKKLILILFLFFSINTFSSTILIPMDDTQTNHLKAYGLTYWVLQNNLEASWLLNYRGGSFLLPNSADIVTECTVRGISYEILADAQVAAILDDISRPEVNMDRVKLEKAPKIAVYAPKSILPWDDAVTLALTYAEIPFDLIYDDEIFAGNLSKYDWLHLHHEDFTGQYGKFWYSHRNAPWYINDVAQASATAKRLGFKKVSQLKLFIAKSIKDFVSRGGFLFAMCSATDSYDISLSAEGIDICDRMFDGDPYDPNAQKKLDYSKTFAFKDYKLTFNPYEYEFSNIDHSNNRPLNENNDFFTLFEFSAKWDPIPSMLCQNHTMLIRGFMGQTTAFDKKMIKSNVLIMGENKEMNEARYIHAEFGKGTWTFYGGHDPEDYQHNVNDPKTDLSLYPNSSGYRLILNNVLFPAAKKKKLKT